MESSAGADDQGKSDAGTAASTRGECDGDTPTGVTVVRLVADHLDADPLDLDPLADRLDPDALDALVGRDGEGPRVEFTYAGCEVAIREDGRIRVSS